MGDRGESRGMVARGWRVGIRWEEREVRESPIEAKVMELGVGRHSARGREAERERAREREI